MLELLQLYWFFILASTLLSGGLALLGAQLASKDRAMQTMCVGQGAMLGVYGVLKEAVQVVPYHLSLWVIEELSQRPLSHLAETDSQR